MRKSTSLLLFILSFVFSFAQKLETSQPEQAGFSTTKLNNISSEIKSWIDKGWMQGASAMIIHDGKIVYHEALGYNDLETKTSLKKDDIYRIASQTKAITSVAIMMLFEEGKLLLDDPVSKYIPAFAGQQVLDKFNAADTTYTTVPAKSEVTIRQLLSHTSGIGYAQIGSKESNAIYAKSNLTAGIGVKKDKLLDAMNRLGKLPLMHQPGEKWTYGLNTDLLGCLVEVISGISLDQFFKTRIFEPLGMKDAYFMIPKEKAGRLINLYQEKDGKLVKAKAQLLNDVTVTPNYPLETSTYYSGGAGLSASIMDYGIFLQMLLNGGTYNGKQILSRNAVRMMTMNQIGDVPFGVDKFGLGFGVVTERGSARTPANEGTFNWGGAFATSYWVDPKEKLVLLFYRQLMGSTHGDVVEKFRAMAYAAMKN